MLDKRLQMSNLFDVYGLLLTDKQQLSLTRYLFEDYSLAEIGEEIGASRQAAYDLVHRAQETMEQMEEKLGFLERTTKARALIEELAEDLRNGANADKMKNTVEQLAALHR
ncbi:putative DNA-binding protein [Selenomonas sp. TAMA-11512]|uniref:YlxM family DNA-binding protein n=1 Tax=Selenomonas sp. TAMA-11512 TaxID=3095337 RepID=UPI0030937289|nr:putative DNA-binding protein [Selenomonas sp. TAMA-11512]